MIEAMVSNPLQVLTVVLMLGALVMVLIRFLLGPGTPDRVVAADTGSVIITAGLAGIALVLSRSIYLDIALVFAALAFVGVIAIARAIEPTAGGDES